MADNRSGRVPSDVVLCAQCPARYRPDPDQAAVLVHIGPIHHWARAITGYAIQAGWRRRADEALLCPAHELTTTRTP